MPPDKVSFCLLPTPMHRLDGMSAHLDIDLWIKRDDLTGFALGGNKGRKLEYLIADALAKHVDVVVTCGAAQSNFVRQLGAACALAHLKCAAAVMDLPYEEEPAEGKGLRGEGGNVVLDHILGVDLRHSPNGTWEELYDQAEALALEYESEGLRVYRIPVGGSSPLGALAFYAAAGEVGPSFDWIVTASSSGSTQTGLAYAFHGTRTKVLGICSDPEPEISHDFAELGEKLADILPLPYVLAPESFRIEHGYVGPGYGIPSEAGNRAIERLARTDGIFLDPIYTGKAFAGLIDIAERGEIEGKVLFWHTGGIPALFA